MFCSLFEQVAESAQTRIDTLSKEWEFFKANLAASKPLEEVSDFLAGINLGLTNIVPKKSIKDIADVEKQIKGLKVELKELISSLNNTQSVHGIILQLPIPDHLEPEELSQVISPEKDVDGFVLGSKFKPATALGVVELLKRSDVKITGQRVVVVGKGKIAGKPTAELLREEGAQVEVIHSETKNPASITKKADILVSAVGKPNLITADMVKVGAVVVDIGTTPVYPKSYDTDTKSRISGDVAFDEVSKVASKITPVPGGVGPMTVAALMQNLVKAAGIY